MELNIESFSSIKGNKFVFFNIRSLVSNINVFKSEFDNSSVVTIGLSETWLNTKLPDTLLSLEGYQLLRRDRVINKRGGGVALYVNKEFNYDIAPDEYNVSNENVEMLSVCIRCPKQKDYLITTVYIPPKANHAAAL